MWPAKEYIHNSSRSVLLKQLAATGWIQRKCVHTTNLIQNSGFPGNGVSRDIPSAAVPVACTSY